MAVLVSVGAADAWLKVVESVAKQVLVCLLVWEVAAPVAVAAWGAWFANYCSLVGVEEGWSALGGGEGVSCHS